MGLLIVFYEKILSIEKATKRKTKDFHPLRSFCASKKLLPLLFNVRLFLFCQLVMVCFTFLPAQKLFVKTKKKA